MRDTKIVPSEVEKNGALCDEILLRAGELLSRPQSGIRVSDLLFPRKTYFARKHPEVKPTEREVGYFIAGRAHHELIEALTTLPGHREQTVEWNGIRGRIDVYKDVPVEIKTTRSMRIKEAWELVDRHPHYFEQLGMYCAIVGCNQGRLLVFHLNVKINSNNTTKLMAYEVRFKDLDAIRHEMAERKTALENAIGGSDLNILPRCPSWMCRDCKYQEFCSNIKIEGGDEK